MGGPSQFVVLGEALIDLVDEGHSPFAAHAGGSPFNVAIGLSRLGRPTAFLGRLSRDPFGTVLRHHAERSEVDLSSVVAAAEPSTVALVTLEGGQARYEFSVEGSADFQWRDDELALPDGTAILHFGSLASWLAPGAAAIDRRLAELHGAGSLLISYDPNVRPALQPDRAAARAQVEPSVAHAHVVKASEEDLAWLYGDESIDAVAAAWLALGPGLVVITRGREGAVAYPGGGPPLTHPARAVPVVDTVGAGDAFTSGLLDALARQGILTPERLPELDVGAALDRAAAVAAITCSRAGADPPWAREFD